MDKILQEDIHSKYEHNPNTAFIKECDETGMMPMTLGMVRSKNKPTDIICNGMQFGNHRTKALALALDKMSEFE